MNEFGEDYYMRGPEFGLSNYSNYSWQGIVTEACCLRMMAALGAAQGDTVHDWGCARGYYVRALLNLGYRATGHDISEWAIENCDSEVIGRVSTHPPKEPADWIICKDVAEHVHEVALRDMLTNIISKTRRGSLIIVPLTAHIGGDYINTADRADSTHVIAWPLPTWLVYIQRLVQSQYESFFVTGGYRLAGVKEAAAQFPCSTGFIVIKKV